METKHKNELREIPGTFGFPLFGHLKQSLSFAKHWYTQLAEMSQKHNSTVFRFATGIKTINILDQKGITALFNPDVVKRRYGFGPLQPPPPRIGDIIPCVFTNGEEHKKLKQFILDLQRKQSSSLISDFKRVASPYFEQWLQHDKPFDWGEDLTNFFGAFLYEYMVGAKPEPKDVQTWGFNLLPRDILRWPGKGDKPIVEAQGRLLESIRSGSKFEEAAKLGKAIGMDEERIAKEVLFFVNFNAYAALHGVIRSLIGELWVHKDWLEKAEAEVCQVVGTPEINFSHLAQLPITEAVIKETLRLHPAAPFLYREAIKDFTLESSSGRFNIKKGDLLNGSIAHAMRDPDVFDNPDNFDPARFLKPNADHYLLWANWNGNESPNSGNHMCAGRDVVYLILKIFLVKLLKDFNWELAEKPHWDLHQFQAANMPKMDFVCCSFLSK